MNEANPPAPVVKPSCIENATGAQFVATEGRLAERVPCPGLNTDFRALFDASPTPFLAVAPLDWIIVEVNGAYLRATGKTREEQIGRQLFDVFPDDPEDPSADGVRNLTASLERVFATRSADTMSVQRYAVQGQDGRFVERWWAPVNTPILGNDGDVVLILHHVEDVTEVVRLRGKAEGQDELVRGQQAVIDRLRVSEAALRESEEFSRRVLQSSADCIKVLRLDGRLERMSEGGQRALGIVDMAAYLETVWAEGFEPGWRAAAHAAVKDAAGGRTGRFEGALTTAKGELRWWDTVLTPILGADGRPERVLAVSRDITDLRVARDRMREGEARFRNMADNAPVMMWVTDPTGFCTYLNARWYEYTGQEPGAGEGYGWLDTVHPDDRPAAQQAFVSANAERCDYRVDFRLRRADGVYRWTIDAAAARFSPDGEYLGYVGSVIDIDERRETEERLALSEEQLRLAIEVGEIGQWDVDHLTGAMFWPPRIKAMFGISPEVPVTLDDFHAGVHPGDRERTRAAYEAASDPDRRPLYDVEYRTIGKEDGVVRWVAAKGRGIFDAAGRCVRVIGTAIDVTARKAAEVRLRDLNERLEQEVAERTAERNRVWEMSRDLFAIMGFDGRLKAINPAWETTLGRDKAALLSVPFPEQVHADDHDAVRAVMEVLLRGESVSRFEDRLRHADGSWRWISWALVPEGDVFYAVGRDVTAEREAAAELVAAQEALRQSQKMEAVGQLTGGVAHDFNNLLTVIRSSTDLLKRPDLPEERRQRYIGAISDTVTRAAKLTGQLLAFARRQALQPEVFDVCKSVTAVSDMVGTLTGSRIKIVTQVPDEACFIHADPSQFDTSIVNMAVNARDAMDGEGTLTITVHAVSLIPSIRSHAPVSGDFVAICVEDTGTGIDPGMIERIFEPFFTTKDVGQGTGLGLSQVFGFAKQSGGEVRVQSTVGKGSMFVLYLPQVAAKATVRDHETEPLVNGHGTCVLVVEDNVAVGTFATQTLAELGYETVWATNADAALAELARDAARFDVVFSDVVMPGMNGIDLAQEIRRRHHDLPVVLTSGYSHVLAQNGTYGFELLHKPYSVEQLSRILRKAGTWKRRRRILAG